MQRRRGAPPPPRCVRQAHRPKRWREARVWVRDGGGGKRRRRRRCAQVGCASPRRGRELAPADGHAHRRAEPRQRQHSVPVVIKRLPLGRGVGRAHDDDLVLDVEAAHHQRLAAAPGRVRVLVRGQTQASLRLPTAELLRRARDDNCVAPPRLHADVERHAGSRPAVGAEGWALRRSSAEHRLVARHGRGHARLSGSHGLGSRAAPKRSAHSLTNKPPTTLPTGKVSK